MIVETNKNTSTGKYEVDIKTNGVVAELDANKEVSIDVSNYSEPVEITPSSGKNGIEKATITLENIPTANVINRIGLGVGVQSVCFINAEADSDGYFDNNIMYIDKNGSSNTIPAGRYRIISGYKISDEYSTISEAISAIFKSGVTYTYDQYYGDTITVQSEYTTPEGNPFSQGTLFLAACEKIY
jgi:hypothetical protein